jgi:isopentenyl-diphosphate delta-isomerase
MRDAEGMSEAATHERREVVLVDEGGRPLGHELKSAAHEAPGQLHLAFSVFLFSGAGKVLLQRRASAKYHFGGIWANACCSHPQPGEELVGSARLRVIEELGITGPSGGATSAGAAGGAETEGSALVLAGPLVDVGQFVYRAEDPVSGLVEHELDHVLVGTLVRTDGRPVEDADLPSAEPTEVDDARWAAVEEVRGAGIEDGFVPWFAEAFEIALAGVGAEIGNRLTS